MNFAVLALVVMAGLLGTLFAAPRRARVPVVIGELVVGVVFGASGLGVLPTGDPTFTFLADMGFALVMFVAGTHVPMRNRALRLSLPVAALRLAMVAVLAAVVGLLLGRLFGTGHGFLYAVLLASSSAALILPSIGDVRDAGPAVQAILPQIALADTAGIVLLPLAIDPAHAGRAARGAAALMAVGVLAFLVLRWADRSGRRRRVHHLSEDRQLTIELRTVLVIVFAAAALATALHVSIMLAGFVVGLAVSAVGEPRRVARQVFSITEGLLAPIFFVWLGASLDLTQLVAHPKAILLGLSLGGTAVAIHAVTVITGQPLALAVLCSGQLGIPVAAATLGTQMQLLAPGEAEAMLLGALVTIGAVALLAPSVRPAPQPT